MSKMQQALAELRRSQGVKGAAIVTMDGLVAAADLDERFQADVIAGLSSYLLMTTNRSLGESGIGSCSRFVLHATHGKAVFVPLDGAFLVVVCDQFAEFSSTQQEVDSVARRLRALARLS
jgi:predicted regulator of Ras-like GTPase activity (Roadblock/LC7/MglB family)